MQTEQEEEEDEEEVAVEEKEIENPSVFVSSQNRDSISLDDVVL